VLVVLFENFQILDAAGPIAAFEIAARIAPRTYDLTIAALGGGDVASSSGARMLTEELKGMRVDRFDTCVIAGGVGVYQCVHDKALIAAIQRAAKHVRRIGSVCSGAFLLAKAGLLDGRAATTHWRSAELLQQLYPNVNVFPDRIYTQDGAVWTSAGISAGIDLALAMIREDLGAEVATQVAREMVVYAQRPGGQSQHSELIELSSADQRFAELNDWVRAHLDQDLSVAALATRAGMSERNFARAYASACGVTPAKAVERLRLEAARALIESGADSVQSVAAACGFHDLERMRRAFQRLYGAPPSAFKRAAGRA